MRKQRKFSPCWDVLPSPTRPSSSRARAPRLLFRPPPHASRRSPPPSHPSKVPDQFESLHRRTTLLEPSPRRNAASLRRRGRGRGRRGGRAPRAERLRRPPPPLVTGAVRVPEAPRLGRPEAAVVVPRRRRPRRLRDVPRNAPRLHPPPVPRVIRSLLLVALALPVSMKYSNILAKGRMLRCEYARRGGDGFDAVGCSDGETSVLGKFLMFGGC